jgi:hypothetical protein
VKKSFLTFMYCMVLKVYTCEEAARGPKTFLNIFCNKMNLPQPDSGPDSNINSPYSPDFKVHFLVSMDRSKEFVALREHFRVLLKFRFVGQQILSIYPLIPKNKPWNLVSRVSWYWNQIRIYRLMPKYILYLKIL